MEQLAGTLQSKSTFHVVDFPKNGIKRIFIKTSFHPYCGTCLVYCEILSCWLICLCIIESQTQPVD